MEIDVNPRRDFFIHLLKGINSLVITTTCNLNCCFCSRKFNPFTQKSYHRDFDEIVEEIKMFIPNFMKTINSSISRMTDGEPFSHPRFWDILKLIREIYPYRGRLRLGDKIQITTNGTYLTEENLKKLDDLKGIIIVHSINSTDIEDWIKLSGSTRKLAEIATTVPKLIKNFDIEYVASVVAMPEVVGYDGIERTIRDLDKNDVKSIRVFLPTYTKYTSKENQGMLFCDENRLKDLIDRLREELKITIWLYPTIYDDITPKMHGFESFGINQSDEILHINNKRIFSRDHANEILLSGMDIHRVTIKTRNEEVKQIDVNPLKIEIKNYLNFIINQDVTFTPEIIEEKVRGCKKILVACSEAGEKIVKKAFEKAIDWSDELKKKEFYFQTVHNDFYEGTVKCAGLLVCRDYEKYIKEFIDKNFKPDIVLMSHNSFDLSGRDLLNEPIYDVCSKLGIKFELVSS